MKPVAIATVAAMLWSHGALAQTAPSEVPEQSSPPAGAADPPVLFHFAGYADATFINSRGDEGSSGAFTLAPIFHVQMGDRLYIETEFELEADDSGERETAIEYANINWLINENLALVAGKFLSPAGYFSQNLHPSWINKVASAPAGFGHGGAAPQGDVGVQLRGGKTFANGQHINYALYYANGPRLMLEGTDGAGEAEEAEEEFEIDLDSAGSPGNRDGKRAVGGRFGWMPTPRLELGISQVWGDVVLDTGGMAVGMDEPSRRYRVSGVDAAWRPRTNLEFRGEWVRQAVGAAGTSLVPEEAIWRAWYLQGAYRFGGDKWEAVVRYSDSTSPHSESTLEQTVIGLNYLLRPYSQVKLDWEFNDSPNEETGSDRLLLQFAYGF
ncbi:MAG: porin [Pseudomonadota bacterium]